MNWVMKVAKSRKWAMGMGGRASQAEVAAGSPLGRKAKSVKPNILSLLLC